MIKKADVVVGLAWGDEAKGKITSELSSKKSESGESYYSYVARWAGGNNAGHTVYVDGVKYKTHLIPSGVFHGVRSVIGPACVIHPRSFYGELDYLEGKGFDTSLVKVSPQCHVVKDSFLQFDQDNLSERLGTTGKGIAPTYAAKAARTGLLAKDVFDSSYLWNGELSGNILCEGAQGVWLDMDAGNYPYVTSSTTLPYGACSLGFPAQKIADVWGAAKMYDTRSGEDPMFPDSLFDDEELSLIGKIGEEFGVTTGRRRKVNWLNLDKLVRAVKITGTTNIVISKCDILDKVSCYKLTFNNSLKEFSSLEEMKFFIKQVLTNSCVPTEGGMLSEVVFSSSPKEI